MKNEQAQIDNFLSFQDQNQQSKSSSISQHQNNQMNQHQPIDSSQSNSSDIYHEDENDSENQSDSRQKKGSKTKQIKKKQKVDKNKKNLKTEDQQKKDMLNENEQYKVKKGRPPKQTKNKKKKGKQTKDNSKSEEDQIAQDQDFQLIYSQCEQPRACFITFFFQIGHKKGLVFNQADRKALNQQLLKSKGPIKQVISRWNPQHQWHKSEEQNKILNAMKGTPNNEGIIILKNFWQKQKANRQLEEIYNYIFKTILETSFIFANQVTEELYKIMVNIINIVVKFQENEELRIKQLISYGEKVLNQKDVKQYAFFNYRFCSKKPYILDVGKNKQNQQNLRLQSYGNAYQNLMKNVGQKIHVALNNIVKDKSIFQSKQKK